MSRGAFPPPIKKNELEQWEDLLDRHCGKETKQKRFLELKEMPVFEKLKIDDPNIKKKLFLIAFVKIGKFMEACNYVGINKATPYKWIKESDLFKQAYGIAKEYVKKLKVQVVEEQLFDRAVGISEEGDNVATKLFLEGNAPETYKQRIDIKAESSVKHNPEDYTDEELVEIIHKEKKKNVNK